MERKAHAEEKRIKKKRKKEKRINNTRVVVYLITEVGVTTEVKILSFIRKTKMETSLRYGEDFKALRIHAKEKLRINSNTYVQVFCINHQTFSSSSLISYLFFP